MTEMFPAAKPTVFMGATSHKEGEFHKGFIIADEEYQIYLSEKEKFMLFELLEQNITINHARTGLWFLSPLAQHFIENGRFKINWRLKVIAWAMKGLVEK